MREWVSRQADDCRVGQKHEFKYRKTHVSVDKCVGRREAGKEKGTRQMEGVSSWKRAYGECRDGSLARRKKKGEWLGR